MRIGLSRSNEPRLMLGTSAWPARKKVLIAAHQEDPVADGDAEQGDESDQRRDVHRAADDQDGEHASGQRQRQVHHEERRDPRTSEGAKHDHEDGGDREQRQNRDPPRRLAAALELTSVLDIVARGQVDLRRDPRLKLLRGPTHITLRDIGADHDFPLDVLAADRVGATRRHDRSQL